MNDLFLLKIGEYFRQIRKEKNLRLEDLAEPGMSASTISNIERGTNHNIKTMRKLAKKLGYSWEELINELKSQKNDVKDDGKEYIRMMAAHTWIDLLKSQEGMGYLPDNSSYQAATPYFKGLFYMKRNQLEKASQQFLEAIRLTDERQDLSHLNGKSMSYRFLARIAYLRNEFEKALELAKKGLDCYIPSEIRDFPYFRLKTDQAIYLYKLGRIEEAYSEAKKIWDLRSKISYVNVLMEAIDIYSRCLRHKKMFKEGLEVLSDGIYIARLNESHDGAYMLWTTMGEFFNSIDDPEEAKYCFETAIHLAEHVNNKEILPPTYRLLGEIYSKEKEWSLAEEYLLKAIKLSKHIENNRDLFAALKSTGEMYLLQEDYAIAIQYFEQALKIAKKQKEKDKVEEILYFIAQSYKCLGMTKYYTILDELITLRFSSAK